MTRTVTKVVIVKIVLTSMSVMESINVVKIVIALTTKAVTAVVAMQVRNIPVKL